MSGSKPPSRSASPAPTGCPMHGVPADPSDSDLTYNDYLKIPELLKLQVPLSQPAHHDELLFIVIHQAYELWFKLILHEMENAIRYMAEKKVLRAHHFMKRITEIMRLLVQQIHILETMSPAEFLEFRDRLLPASGFQSVQFREIEFAAGLKDPAYLAHFRNRPDFVALLQRRMNEPDLKSAYYRLLHALGPEMPSSMPADAAELESRVLSGELSGEAAETAKNGIIRAILPIYQEQEQHLPLYLLSESLLEFDEYFALWREHHVKVVERVIGFKRGTGGSNGVAYLQSTTGKKIFPYLWEVRTYLEKPK